MGVSKERVDLRMSYPIFNGGFNSGYYQPEGNMFPQGNNLMNNVSYQQAQYRLNQLQGMDRSSQSSNPYFKAVPVMSFDEAKAAMVAYDGSLNIFVDVQNNKIYTKQLNTDGLAEFKVYKLSQEEQATSSNAQYVERIEFDLVLEELEALRTKLETLGGNK